MAGIVRHRMAPVHVNPVGRVRDARRGCVRRTNGVQNATETANAIFLPPNCVIPGLVHAIARLAGAEYYATDSARSLRTGKAVTPFVDVRIADCARQSMVHACVRRATAGYVAKRNAPIRTMVTIVPIHVIAITTPLAVMRLDFVIVNLGLKASNATVHATVKRLD